MQSKEVIRFWFEELTPADHFRKNPELDTIITQRFSKTLDAAKAGELFHWRGDTLGRLAEIIVLDQFSRNIYRDHKNAFEADAVALVLAQTAITLGVDQQLSSNQKSFLYMPFMHSESLVIHEEAVRLFSQPGLENTLSFELKHKIIIEKFGRYPHRNRILSRSSTPEEIEFLATPGSSF